MILEYAFAADEAHGVARGAEKPLSPESYRKKIIQELSWTHSGETRVVGRISAASRQTRDFRDWFPRGGSAAWSPQIRSASGQSQ